MTDDVKDSKPRVLVTIPYLGGQGGVANLYTNIYEHLREQSVKVDFLEIGSELPGRFHLIRDQLRFRNAISNGRVNLVHVNPSFGLKSFLRDGFFIWFCKHRKIPVLVFFHGWKKDFEPKMKRYCWWFFRATYGKAERFIVLASEVKDSLHQWGICAPITVERNAVNDELIKNVNMDERVRQIWKTEKLNILFLARVEKNKGIFLALEAARILREKGIDFHFNIAGDGPIIKDVKRYILSNQLSRNVSLLGYVRGNRKRQVFFENHIYFLPSYSEGLPISVLEAMSLGLPVITRSVGGLKDFFRDGLMGRITESVDPVDFAFYLEEILSDREKLIRMAQFNFAYAADNFYPSKVTTRLINIYKEFVF